MNLGTYLFYRFSAMILQILGAVALVFAMLSIIPYDPTVFFLFSFRGSGEQRDIQLAQLKSELGIDVPIYVQYFRFLRGLFLDGSMGTSWTSGNEVREIVFISMEYTVVVFGIAFLIYTPLAFGLGIVSALKRGQFVDNMTRVLTTATYAIPSYVLGLYLLIVGINLFDLGLYIERGGNPPILSKRSILPILTVIMAYSGFQFRFVRVHVLHVLRQDYIRTARAKGLSERTILFKHALRNAVPLLITTIAVTFPIAFSGVAAIEVVFNIPGIGNTMVRAATNFDWPVLIGTTTVFTIINTIILTFTDVLIYFSSPRVRMGENTTYL